MKYDRLTSPTALSDAISKLTKRVSRIETKGTGSISFIDANTGEETIIGTLPDGSTGVEQFIGDTTPPPVATIPLVSTVPGSFIVGWDGLFVGGAEQPRDFVHVNVVGHQMNGTDTLLSTVVGVIRLPSEVINMSTDIAAAGEYWQFSLESEDYNGNKAVESTRSESYLMIDAISSTDIAWTDMQTDVAEAKSTAAQAQSDAAQASSDAQEAIDIANAAGTGGQGSTYMQDTAPPVEAQTATTLWIDTTNGANTPKRWDGTSWVAITDKAATDAAQAAVDAKARADDAFNKATNAATAAGDAQTTADGKNKVWYLDSAPAGTAHKINDIWFDTANDNRLNKWDGNAWIQSLLGNSALYGNIDAGKITVGYLTAAVIKAKSLGVDKLMITSTDNLLMEGDFGNNATSWQTSATKYISPTAGRSGMPAFRFTGLAGLITSLNINNRIPISPDARFRGSMWIKSSVTAPADVFKIVGRFYYNATQFNDIVIASNKAVSANTWTNVDGIIPATIPSNTIAAEFYISITNASIGAIVDVDFISVTRASDGKLIVDGAIDGKTITGATVQTAVSGPRIVLDQTSLNAWNTAGDNYFNMSDATGVNISSKGRAGYELARYNICENPSFEVDTFGWSTLTGSIARDTTQKYIGTASLKSTHTATAVRSVTLSQYTTDYYIWASAYVRHNSDTAKSMRVDVRWTDATSTDLGTTTGVAVSVPPNTWTRLNVGPTGAGSNADTIKFDVVAVSSFTATETFWVDAVLLDASATGTTPTYGSYFDGSNPRVGSYSYTWDSTPNQSKSIERLDRNVKIKSGGNDILEMDNMGTAQLAYSPGIGFIREAPFKQTAGLFSNGQITSIVEGSDTLMGSRLDVGGGSVYLKSTGDITLEGAGTNWISGSTTSISSGAINLMGNTNITGTLNGVSLQDNDATAPTFANGWTNFGGGYGNVQVKEIAPGVVLLQGMVKAPATGRVDGQTIAVVPAAFRPTRIQNMPLTIRTSQAMPNSNQPGLLQVHTNGNLNLFCEMTYVSYINLSNSYFLYGGY